MGGIGEAEKRRLFDEHVTWWRMYDMTMRPVPESWEDFQRYWKRMCADVLEDNKATRDVLDLAGIAKPPFLPWLPDALWRPVSVLVARNFVWLTTGLYDREIRDRLGLRWSERDARRHRRVGKLINAVFTLVPHDRRYHPRARVGFGAASAARWLRTPPWSRLHPGTCRRCPSAANPSTTRRTSRRSS